MKSPDEHAAEVELVARTYHDRMFEERWDELHENGIDKALHRACASEAIKALDRARDQARNKPLRGAISRSDYKL
jgi:hypothetical protein